MTYHAGQVLTIRANDEGGVEEMVERLHDKLDGHAKDDRGDGSLN